MNIEVPPDWNVEERRQYTPAESDRELQYRTYRHESGDLRLRIAPASLDGDDHPGYTLTAVSYPGLDISETTTVRSVLTVERCLKLGRRFMALFSASYDGPGSLEEAVEYAYDRTREHR
ncbi:hypothetical protein OB905_08690 [Halobacteria archaeon AArc-dxtr1]|nr:hypothetical protein [Halobacteria archaeon AArc-dxtr1]